MNASNDQSFGRVFRLRKQVEFDRVYESDFYAADPFLVIRGTVNELSHCRLGLSVSRKVGNAVVRNRWKRLIREAFRKNRNGMPIGIDLVVRPRRGAKCKAAEIERSLPKLVRVIDKKIRKSKLSG